MVDIFSEEEKRNIKRPSDAYRLLQKKLKRKRESPYAILADTEKYLAWFIPIISSVFFIFIGISIPRRFPICRNWQSPCSCGFWAIVSLAYTRNPVTLLYISF